MRTSRARNTVSCLALCLTVLISALLLAPESLSARAQVSLAGAARRSKAKASSNSPDPAIGADTTGSCAAGSTGRADAGGKCASDRAPLTAIDATFDVGKLTPDDVKSLLAAAQTWQVDKPDKNATRGLNKWDAKEFKQSLKACNSGATPNPCEEVAAKLRTPDSGYDSFDFTAEQTHYQVYQALFRACALENAQKIADDNTCSAVAQAIGTPTENIAAALAAIDDSPSCELAAKKWWPDVCVSSAFFSVPGGYRNYYDLPVKIQKVGDDVCRRTGRGCGSLTAWKSMRAAPTQVASATTQDDSAPASDAQQIQDKIDSLNSEIQQLEGEKQNDEQSAEQAADYSNCASVGYGTFAAIGAAGCRTADEIAEAKAREAVNQDSNKIDDDRAEIARLQGEEVQERPHHDASFAGALNQVSQENGQTSIQDTANQQAANMIAVGAANDAARAQAAAAQRAAQMQAQQQQQALAAQAQAESAQASAQQSEQLASASSQSSAASATSGQGCGNFTSFVTVAQIASGTRNYGGNSVLTGTLQVTVPAGDHVAGGQLGLYSQSQDASAYNSALQAAQRGDFEAGSGYSDFGNFVGDRLDFEENPGAQMAILWVIVSDGSHEMTYAGYAMVSAPSPLAFTLNVQSSSCQEVTGTSGAGTIQ